MHTPTHQAATETTAGDTTITHDHPTVIDLDVDLDQIEAEAFDRLPDHLTPTQRADAAGLAVQALIEAAQSIPGVQFWAARTRHLGVLPGHAPAQVRARVVAFVAEPEAGVLSSVSERVTVAA